MLDVEYVVAIVASTVGVTASAVVFFALENCETNGKRISFMERRDAALMMLAGCLSVGSILPQLIKNQQLGSEMDSAISPFFPAISPVIMFARIPANYDLLKDAKSSDSYFNVVITVVFHAFILIAFITWNYQYAVFTQSESTQQAFFALAAVYTLLALAYVWWVLGQVVVAWETTTVMKTTEPSGDQIFSFDNIFDLSDEGDEESLLSSSAL